MTSRNNKRTINNNPQQYIPIKDQQEQSRTISNANQEQYSITIKNNKQEQSMTTGKTSQQPSAITTKNNKQEQPLTISKNNQAH